MIQLKRKLVLTLSSSSGNILVAKDLRVDFVVEKSIGEALNTAKFQVYNLAPETISTLSNQVAGSVKVKLEVGNVNSSFLDLLFQGDLINVHSTPVFEDHITNLWCWERGNKPLEDSIEQPETLKGADVKSIITKILNTASKQDGSVIYKANFDAVTGGKQDSIVNAYVTQGVPRTAISRLLAQYGMTSNTRGDTLFVTDAIDNKDSVTNAAHNDKVTKFEVNPLLLKKPVQYSKATADITYSLSPDVNPLDVVYINYKGTDAQSNLGGYGDRLLQIVDGIKDLLPKDFYFISKIIHTGSLYTDSWDTQIRGIVFSDSIKD